MARTLPSLNALRAFEAAARRASFTLAAEELNVTHAAISRHIRELEARLGTSLFVRTGRGVALTDTGRMLGARLTPLFDAIAEAAEAATTRSRGRGRTLSISVEVAFASSWLVPRLGSFTERHPEVELAIDPSDRLVDFRSTACDIALRYGRGAWPEVAAEELVALDVFPVVSPELHRRLGIEEPGQLDRAVLLHQESRQAWADWLALAGLPSGQRPGPSFQGHLALQAAIAGQGYALGDTVTAADAMLAGTLIKPFAPRLKAGSYFLVSAPHATPTPAARAFRNWLEAELRTTLEAMQRLVSG